LVPCNWELSEVNIDFRHLINFRITKDIHFYHVFLIFN